MAKRDQRYRFWMMGTDEDAIMTVVTDLSDPKSLILRTVTCLGNKMTHTHSREDTASCKNMFHETQKFNRW